MATQNRVGIKKTASSKAAPSRRRKKKNPAGRALLSVALFLLVVSAIVLCFTVFFKVKSIDIYGESRYKSALIKNAGGVNLEDNLLLVDSKKVSRDIEKKLPYIESVKIKKKFPSTLRLDITPATVAGYAEYENKYYVLSSKGKVLGISSTEPENMLKIDGFDLKGIAVSETVKDDKRRLFLLDEMVSVFEDEILNITRIDMTDIINITFEYDGRITVEFGSISDASEKIKFAKAILLDKDKISDDDEGTIYVSDSKKMSFRRKEEVAPAESSGVSSENESEKEKQNESTPTESGN